MCVKCVSCLRCLDFVNRLCRPLLYLHQSLVVFLPEGLGHRVRVLCAELLFIFHETRQNYLSSGIFISFFKLEKMVFLKIHCIWSPFSTTVTPLQASSSMHRDKQVTIRSFSNFRASQLQPIANLLIIQALLSSG